MKISYGITVHNETEELNRLLQVLIKNIDEEDEIIICDDFSNKETLDVIDPWDLHSSDSRQFKVYKRKLENDFAAHKNSVIENANGDFSSGTLYLGFNISRSFTLKSEDEKSW